MPSCEQRGISEPHRWQVHEDAAVLRQGLPPAPPLPLPPIAATLECSSSRAAGIIAAPSLHTACEGCPHAAQRLERMLAGSGMAAVQFCGSKASHRVPAVQPGVAGHGSSAGRPAGARGGRAVLPGRAQHLRVIRDPDLG